MILRFRVCGALLLLVAAALPSGILVRAALPAAYADYAPTYVRGFDLLRILLAAGSAVALLGARPLARLFATAASAAVTAPIWSRTDTRLALALLALAFALRVYQPQPSLTYDEVFLAQSLITQNPVKTLVHPSGSSHALHTLLSNLCVRLAGRSEWAIRFPALVFGALAPAVLFAFLRLQAGRRFAVAAGLALALTPLHVWYSQEAKGNGAQVLMVVLSWLCLAGLARRWRGGLAVACVVCLFLSALAHLSGLLVALLQGVACAALPLAGPPDGERGALRGRFAALHAIGFWLALVYYAPIAYFLLEGGQNVTEKEGAMALLPLLGDVWERFTALDMHPVFRSAAGVLAAVGAVRLGRARPALLTLCAAPFALGLAVVGAAGLFAHARYFMYFLPGLCVLLAAGAVGVVPAEGACDRAHAPVCLRGALCAAATALGVFVLLGYAGSLAQYYGQPKSNLRAAAAYVRQAAPEREPYVIGLNANCYPALGMTWYLDRFQTDETVGAWLRDLTAEAPDADVWVVVIDPLHFEVGYPVLRARLRSAGAPVASFACLGELDQYRVRDTHIYRMRAAELAVAVAEQVAARKTALR